MSEDDDLGSEIFGWVGTALAQIFYISPIVPYIRLIKGDIKLNEVPGILLLCSFLNCILWSDYGLLQDLFNVYFANGLGATISLIYIVMFLIYLAEKKILLSLVYILFLIACIVELYFIFYYLVDPFPTSILANVFNVLMYAAPGEKIYTVFKTGNYELIPIWSTIGGTICSTSWMFYGIYKNEIMLIIPNALGIVASIIQLVVYFIFRFKKK